MEGETVLFESIVSPRSFYYLRCANVLGSVRCRCRLHLGGLLLALLGPPLLGRIAQLLAGRRRHLVARLRDRLGGLPALHHPGDNREQQLRPLQRLLLKVLQHLIFHLHLSRHSYPPRVHSYPNPARAAPTPSAAASSAHTTHTNSPPAHPARSPSGTPTRAGSQLPLRLTVARNL